MARPSARPRTLRAGPSSRGVSAIASTSEEEDPEETRRQQDEQGVDENERPEVGLQTRPREDGAEARRRDDAAEEAGDPAGEVRPPEVNGRIARGRRGEGRQPGKGSGAGG